MIEEKFKLLVPFWGKNYVALVNEDCSVRGLNSVRIIDRTVSVVRKGVWCIGMPYTRFLPEMKTLSRSVCKVSDDQGGKFYIITDPSLRKDIDQFYANLKERKEMKKNDFSRLKGKFAAAVQGASKKHQFEKAWRDQVELVSSLLHFICGEINDLAEVDLEDDAEEIIGFLTPDGDAIEFALYLESRDRCYTKDEDTLLTINLIHIANTTPPGRFEYDVRFSGEQTASCTHCPSFESLQDTLISMFKLPEIANRIAEQLQ